MNVHNNRRTVKKEKLPSDFPDNPNENAPAQPDLNEDPSSQLQLDVWPFSVIDLQNDIEAGDIENTVTSATESTNSNENFQKLVDSNVKIEKFKEIIVQLQNKLKEKSAAVKKWEKAAKGHERAAAKLQTKLEEKSTKINDLEKIRTGFDCLLNKNLAEKKESNESDDPLDEDAIEFNLSVFTTLQQSNII